ncbi:hypothetical protein ACN2WE_01115 [Streptomyces sp. cg28]|uniref:hypothetical protein n=1 Tax=Streptomyces sp. cg28 TaxID=3403457 RepID=UPI003B2132E9
MLGFCGRLCIADYIGLIAVLYAGFVLVRADAQSATACLARLVGVTDLGGAPAGADTGRDEPWQATVLDVDRVGHTYSSGRPLIVAHRLTQAVTADRVVVLERGRVAESGPHEVEPPGSGDSRS